MNTKIMWWTVGGILALVVIIFCIYSFLSWQGANAPEVNSSLAIADMIHVATPLPDVLVQSPLSVTGEARGNWYFEASFPVKVLDANGTVLGQVPAQANGNWMTTDFVPFQATLTFATSTTETGTVVFQKDNPSGNPATDQSLSIPVYFSSNVSKL